MAKIRKKFNKNAKNEAKPRPVAPYVPLKEDQLDYAKIEKAVADGSAELQYFIRTQMTLKMTCRVCSAELNTLPQLVAHKRKICRMRMDTTGEEAISEALLGITEDPKKKEELAALLLLPPKSKNARDIVAASEKPDKSPMLRKLPDSTRIVNGKQLCPSPKKQDLYRKDKLEAEKREISTVVMPKEPKLVMDDFYLRIKKKEVLSRDYEECELGLMDRLSMHPSACKFADLATRKCLSKQCANEPIFADLESLAYHITAYHPMQHNVYQCLVCGIVFVEYKLLREHVENDHTIILWKHKAHREAQEALLKSRKRKLDGSNVRNEMEFDDEEPMEKQRKMRRAARRKTTHPQKFDGSDCNDSETGDEEEKKEHKLLDKFAFRESLIRVAPQGAIPVTIEELEEASTSFQPTHTWNVPRVVARKHIDFQKDVFERAIGWLLTSPTKPKTRASMHKAKTEIAASNANAASMKNQTIRPIIHETRSATRQPLIEAKPEPNDVAAEVTDHSDLKLKISRKNFEIVQKKPKNQEAKLKLDLTPRNSEPAIVADIVSNLVKRVVRKEYKESYKQLFNKKPMAENVESARPQRVRQSNKRYVDEKDFVIPSTYRRGHGNGSSTNTPKITPNKSSPKKKVTDNKDEPFDNDEDSLETPLLDGPYLDNEDENESSLEATNDSVDFMDDERMISRLVRTLVRRVEQEQSIEPDEATGMQRSKRTRKLPNWMDDELLDIGYKKSASSSRPSSPKAPVKKGRKSKDPSALAQSKRKSKRQSRQQRDDSIVLPCLNGGGDGSRIDAGRMTPASPFDSPSSSRRKQDLQGITDDSEAKILQVNQKNSKKAVEDMAAVPVYLTPYQRAQFFSHLVPIGKENGPNEPHRCKDCGVEFKNHKDGRRHVVGHIRVIRIRCTLCKVGSFFISEMRNHLMFRHCQRLDKTPTGVVDTTGRLPCMSQPSADSFIEFVDQANLGHVSYTSGKIISILSLKPYLPDARIEESILGPTRFAEHPLIIPEGVDPEIAANQGVLIPCPHEPEGLSTSRNGSSPGVLSPLTTPNARKSILGKNVSPRPAVLASPTTRLAPIVLPAAGPFIDPQRPEFKRFPRLKDGDYLDVAEMVEVVDE